MAQRKLMTGIFLTLFTILFVSCREKIFTGDVDCGDYGCFLDKPDSVDLIIHWTQENKGDEIPVLLYSGTLDKGEFLDTFYIFEDPAYIYVEVEKEYTLKALYEGAYNEKDVWVVDGTKTKLKRVSDYCEKGTCWMADHADLYLQLKY